MILQNSQDFGLFNIDATYKIIS